MSNYNDCILTWVSPVTFNIANRGRSINSMHAPMRIMQLLGKLHLSEEKNLKALKSLFCPKFFLERKSINKRMLQERTLIIMLIKRKLHKKQNVINNKKMQMLQKQICKQNAHKQKQTQHISNMPKKQISFSSQYFMFLFHIVIGCMIYAFYFFLFTNINSIIVIAHDIYWPIFICISKQ